MILRTVNYVKRGNSVGASATNEPVSLAFGINSFQAKNFLAAIVAEGVTSATAITAKLQHSYDDGQTFVDVGDQAQATITGDGVFYIRANIEVAAAAAQLPLFPTVRVVVSSGAGDAATVSAVWVSGVQA